MLTGLVVMAVSSQVVSAPCGDVTAIGACQGNLASWCLEGNLQAVDCTQAGLSCGWEQKSAGYRCIPKDCTPPQVLIILDKSSSMNYPAETGRTKWESATAAVNSLVASFGSTIDFGLMVYPGTGGQCTPGEIAVDVGGATVEAISGYLADPPPVGGNYTPMAQSLEVVANYKKFTDPLRQSFVLLVTDGWQWCDPYDINTRFDAAAAAASLHATGVQTFVLGFGGGVDVLNNNQIAVAGGTALPNCDPNTDAPGALDLCYHQTASQAQLEAAFTAIARRVAGEVCDGVDNDCDGIVDNQTPNQTDPLTQACNTGCGAGVSVCEHGQWSECRASGPCDDGNPCTQNDWCSGDACNGTPKDCDDGNPGTLDTCDPETGTCQHTDVTGPCDDLNACTTNDFFDGVTCLGEPIICDDNNACTTDSCDPATGCVFVPAPFGESCDDNDPCTTADYCLDGVCGGATIPGCGGNGENGNPNDPAGTELAGGLAGGCNCGTTPTSVATLVAVGAFLASRFRRRTRH